MIYRSTRDKHLMALLTHYERTVRAFDKTAPGQRQRPHTRPTAEQAAYLAACDALLRHIEATVNEARDEGALNLENNRGS